jgi:hypothetical protein
VGGLRIATEHGAQAHARPQIAHQLDSIELLEPVAVVEDLLASAYRLRVVVLDAEALDVGPELVELATDALNVHRLHISPETRAGGRASRGVADLYCSSAELAVIVSICSRGGSAREAHQADGVVAVEVHPVEGHERQEMSHMQRGCSGVDADIDSYALLGEQPVERAAAAGHS